MYVNFNVETICDAVEITVEKVLDFTWERLEQRLKMLKKIPNTTPCNRQYFLCSYLVARLESP